MIQIEDSSFIFENEFYIIVPFEYTLTSKGLEVITYDIFEDVAHEFINSYKDRLFENSAYDFLKSKIDAKINEYGYVTCEDEFYEHSLLYRIDDAEQINGELILDSTIKYFKNDNYTNLTDIDFDLQEGRTAYITVSNNNIVSYAMEYYTSADDEFREIGVETNPQYYNHGFALSNTAALAKDIINRNMYATYMCGCNNIPSQRVANKVGFKEYAKEYHYVCYRR